MAQTADKATTRKAYTPRDNTKAMAALGLMLRPAGASMEELMVLTGWSRSSIRGFVVGPQFARLGYKGVRKARTGGTGSSAYFAEEIKADVRI